MTTHSEGATRRVRPWLAALLTFVGWGVGLYYARRAGAVWWAIVGVIAGAAVSLGVVAYAVYTGTAPLDVVNPARWSLVELIQIGLSAALAIGVWMLAARRQTVEQGPPTRIVGYVLIWILPIIASMLLALAVRFMVVHPFRMPSGSMQPTLEIGQHFAVSKWSYGYSRYSFAPFQDLLPRGRRFVREPECGDILVFRPDPEPDRDFVKRLIGLPGDRIQMIDGHLHINGAPVERQSLGVREFENEDDVIERISAFRETLPNGVSYTVFDRTPRSELDNTRVFVVPPGHYFMMGDDRDNSADSRVLSVVGYVPLENLIGRVDFIEARSSD